MAGSYDLQIVAWAAGQDRVEDSANSRESNDGCEEIEGVSDSRQVPSAAAALVEPFGERRPKQDQARANRAAQDPFGAGFPFHLRQA